MEGWLTGAFKYLKDRPDVIALLVVIGILGWVIVVLCKLLTRREKSIADLISQVMGGNAILAKLATLIEVLVYRKEGSK
jgi:hypothetical protein